MTPGDRKQVVLWCSIPGSPRLGTCSGTPSSLICGSSRRPCAGSAWTRLHKVVLTERSWHLLHPQVWGKAGSDLSFRHHAAVVHDLTFVSKANGGEQPPKLANKILAPSGTVLFISLRWPGITSALREINGPAQPRLCQTSVLGTASIPAHKPSKNPVTSVCGSQLRGSQQDRVWDAHPSLAVNDFRCKRHVPHAAEPGLWIYVNIHGAILGPFQKSVLLNKISYIKG